MLANLANSGGILSLDVTTNESNSVEGKRWKERREREKREKREERRKRNGRREKREEKKRKREGEGKGRNYGGILSLEVTTNESNSVEGKRVRDSKIRE
jgi:hypothetical protein